MKMTEEKNLTEENVKQETPIVIDEMIIPIINPKATVREEIEEDGKYILFNAENELILVINTTGKFILDNCNGDKTVCQIIKDLKKAFIVKGNIDLPSIVKGFVSTLLKAELVTIKENKK